MGNTPNFAIPYPEPTDYVSDGAAQMENLAERADLGMYALGMGRNRLINGDMRIAQRGATFVAGANNDNTYNLDRWCLLSDGNDIVDVYQTNVAPPAGIFSMGLDVETANKKFGILQVIEQRNITGIYNQDCTLSFYARTSGSSIGNLKAVVLSWTGTADSVTRDVVSSWNADGVTPTWATNWTAENTPTNLAPSNDWTRYTITMKVDTASLNNVAVFIWSDDMTTTVGDFLYITDVQFEVGALATPFERRQMQQELALCQRYYWKWTSSSAYAGLQSTISSTTTSVEGALHHALMRVAPSLDAYSTLSTNDAVAANTAITAVDIAYKGNPSSLMRYTVASGLTTYRAYNILSNNSSSAYLALTAEL